MSFQFSTIKRFRYSDGLTKENLDKALKDNPSEPLFWTLGDVFVDGIDAGTGKFTFIDRRDDLIEVDCEVVKSERVFDK